LRVGWSIFGPVDEHAGNGGVDGEGKGEGCFVRDRDASRYGYCDSGRVVRRRPRRVGMLIGGVLASTVIRYLVKCALEVCHCCTSPRILIFRRSDGPVRAFSFHYEEWVVKIDG